MMKRTSESRKEGSQGRGEHREPDAPAPGGEERGPEPAGAATADAGGKESGAARAVEDDLRRRIEALEAEKNEVHDRFLRAAAELENFRKRSARQMEDSRKFSNESLLRDLLPVVDNLERAISFSQENGPDAARVIEGVELTLTELINTLKRHGVQPIESVGKPFDPNFHQAVLQEERPDQPPNTVLSEIHKGYTLHDRLLRAAMVVVSKGGSGS